MKKIIRFNPIDPMNIFDEFDRMMRQSTMPAAAHTWNIAMDVAENEDGYIVKATLPGINVDDLDITLEDGVLSLKGEFKADAERENERYHVRERQMGSFSRRVRFPMMVNGDAVKATYKDGILTLEIPKAEVVKPKRITVNIN